MTTRLVVVSDTHLSRERTPEATANWDAVVDHIAATGPDLVVHAGDVTADGPAHPDDLLYAGEQMARLSSPLGVVPGNHDVGEIGGVTSDRLHRYRSALGPDRWYRDVAGWRIVGIDALLFGSGLDDEAEQWSWLADVARLRHPGRIALVLHKPLVPPPRRPGDVKPARYVPPAARKWLRAMLVEAGLGAVISGHAHQYARDRQDGVAYIWAPSTWAVIPDHAQPVLGERVCGTVDVTLHAHGRIDVRLRRPPGLAQHTLGETVKNPYS